MKKFYFKEHILYHVFLYIEGYVVLRLEKTILINDFQNYMGESQIEYDYIQINMQLPNKSELPIYSKYHRLKILYYFTKKYQKPFTNEILVRAECVRCPWLLAQT